MKTILLLLSLAFLPLFAFSTCTTNTHENQAFGVIYDTEGKPLNKHSRYFIVSPIRGAGGGGVRLANLGNQKQNTCPTSVVQSHNDLDNGIAVYFKPEDPEHDIIREFTPINIKFYLDSPSCANFTMWKVDNFLKPGVEKYTISTGEQLTYSFRIRPLGGSMYMLIFCPFGEIMIPCFNVGITAENGYRRLVATESTAKPFVFVHDKRIGMSIM